MNVLKKERPTNRSSSWTVFSVQIGSQNPSGRSSFFAWEDMQRLEQLTSISLVPATGTIGGNPVAVRGKR